VSIKRFDVRGRSAGFGNLGIGPTLGRGERLMAVRWPSEFLLTTQE